MIKGCERGFYRTLREAKLAVIIWRWSRLRGRKVQGRCWENLQVHEAGNGSEDWRGPLQIQLPFIMSHSKPHVLGFPLSWDGQILPAGIGPGEMTAEFLPH